MKDPVLFTRKSDLHDYFRAIWKTEHFRRSHDRGGLVHRMVERYARLPRFIADMSDEYLERAHFNMWWSGLHPRRYDKAACNDLYLLHEISHGADMTHAAGLSAEGFYRKMTDNELYASVISEIAAYFDMPDLRKDTFQEEIFADRFLRDPVCQAQWREDPERLLGNLCLRRHRAMNAPAKGDKIEQWLHGFTGQNMDWYRIWLEKFDVVETAMEKFIREALTGNREDALKRHIDWLYAQAKGGDIPFPDQAAAFAEIYWRNRAASQVERAA